MPLSLKILEAEWARLGAGIELKIVRTTGDAIRPSHAMLIMELSG